MSGAAIPASLQRRYDVCVKQIPIGRWAVLDILTVRDPDALIDRIDPRAFEKDERLPYWAEIWPSAIGMGLHLYAHPVQMDEPALELGCGVGVAGIAAAMTGMRVHACDYDRDALSFTRHNAERNGVGRRISVRHLDWRTPERVQPYRLVIGSDIVYERPDHKPLVDFLDITLATGGAFLLSDPNRNPARAFAALMEQRGYGHTSQPWFVRFDNTTSRITVHRFIKTW